MMNKFELKILLILLAVTLTVSSVALAVNNRPEEETGDERVATALATIEQKKIEAREAVSRALAKDLEAFEKEWGIKLIGIRWTAAGYMLDMRLRVLDQDKAFPLLKRHVKRYILVEKSGAVLEVPFTQKLGSLKSTVRTSNMVKKDHIYNALFANPSKHVQPGDKVTLVIGNFMAENLVVQ
jgi:hypothetical protein